MARIMAIDYGKRRTGLAVTDTFQIIAQGLTTVETPSLIYFLKNYFKQEAVELVIIGYPLNLDDQPTDATPLVDKFLKNFKSVFPDLPYKLVDESFTSKQAFQTMIDSGLKRKARQNKALIDEISATIILQEFLGHR